MLNKTIFSLLIFISISIVKAQEIIPFRITKHNNIIVKALVNDKDSLHLMFQIAMEEASISPERTRKADHIIFKDEISDGNTIKIGNKKYENIRFFDNELTGHEADGKIGTGIFKDKYFKIDYNNNQFVSYDKEPDLKDYQPMNLYVKNGQFYIVADNVVEDKQQEAYFLLQSGYSGGLLYSNEFAEANDLNEKLKITGEKSMKNSAGQIITTKQGVLPFLKLGNIVLKNISAGFFTGDLKTQHANYFAADVMRRFNWIFDKDRKVVYIKPSKYFNEPYYKIN
ncbi:hypothetical protein J3D55_002121 [Chryseobacterium ginsenosidimutans]|uniref:hypothetical protein n=1 Tax=Chryseobacterium ginsenosidimutans TaxID=687846 RepID=UPI0021694013|nr:hypothetical protein [Chryseobacterium ginsenosidimutans]MCS3869205.1 hypothetical protein [Chryseobacterium ginsenosidimutans]